MKKIITIFLLTILFSCTTNKGVETIDFSKLNSPIFKELYVSHDVTNGNTEVILYAVDFTEEQFLALKEDMTEQYYSFDRFKNIQEYVTTEGENTHIKLVMTAKNPLEHGENLTLLFSELLKMDVIVEDYEVIPFETYQIIIAIPLDEAMYFPTGNSLGVFSSEDETKALYIFDIFNDPIEFLIGFNKS